MNKLSQILQIRKYGFSLAEALITLLIVCIITLASIPILTKKKRAMLDNQRHGYYACYWDASGKLQAKMMYNSVISDGKVVWDAEERRYGCEFNPPSGAKNFVATIIGGGGGGAGAASISGYNLKHFTKPGLESWTAPETGTYDIIAVGGGGGGGSGDDEYEIRGGAGTPGDIVYISNVIIEKGRSIQVLVGAGGNVAQYYSDSGKDGTISRVKIGVPDITLFAQGGGGGVGYDVHPDFCGVLSAFTYKLRKGSIHGYNSNNEFVTYDFGCGDGQPRLYMKAGKILEEPKIMFGVKNFTAYYDTLQGGRSTFDTEVGGDDKNKYTWRIFKSTPAKAWNTQSQNKQKYYNNPNLTYFNDKFFKTFNNPVFGSPVALYMWGKKNCLKWKLSNDIDAATRAGGYCLDYEDNYGAGGGGGGSTDMSTSYGAFKYNVYGIAGKDGYVGIRYKPVYAGLGGEAGKVMQIPYSELPQKTLLFPGRGGRGGQFSPAIKDTTPAADRRTNETEGYNGESSYIKNGTPVLGGAGAPKIDTDNESTYSTEKSPILTSYIAGGNGKLSDVLTSKKETVGGQGGLNGTNNSIHGASLNRAIFQNGAAIGSFNRIYGAGAGGGGGSAFTQPTLTVNGQSANYSGNGGDGASGLVFIQW